MIFRNAPQSIIINREELKGVELKTLLRAREDGLILLKSLVE